MEVNPWLNRSEVGGKASFARPAAVGRFAGRFHYKACGMLDVRVPYAGEAAWVDTSAHSCERAADDGASSGL